VKKFLENSQGLPRYMGSNKNVWRHLAAKRKLGGGRKGEFVAGIEAYNVLKYGDRGPRSPYLNTLSVGFLELEIWCIKVCI